MRLKIACFWMKTICQGLCIGSVVLGSGCASFELTSIPEGAVLFEGTERIGSTPYPFDQFSGERIFTVKKSGYVEQEVLVSSLDQKSVEVQLDRVKTTVLNTVPTDVRVVRTGGKINQYRFRYYAKLHRSTRWGSGPGLALTADKQISQVTHFSITTRLANAASRCFHNSASDALRISSPSSKKQTYLCL